MGIDKDWDMVPKKKGHGPTLTKQSVRFLKLLVSGVKTVEAYRTAGYKGLDASAYALKTHLKKELAQRFEAEGISGDRYRAELLKLLSLPCVDSKKNPLDSLTFNQRLEILKLLRDELPDKPQRQGSITSFTITRYDAKGTKDKSKRDEIPGDVLDITPIRDSLRGSDSKKFI